MLSKQSIRKEHTIYLNGKLLEKDEMIEIGTSCYALCTPPRAAAVPPEPTPSHTQRPRHGVRRGH